MQYIDATGLTRLFKVLDMEVDHTLITALIEWWRSKMHTFHLPYGEMGITLQDIEVMLGILVDGFPVTRKTDMKWSEVCRDLLGHEHFARSTELKQVYPCWGEDKIQVA